MDQVIEVGDWVEIVNWCKEWNGLAIVRSINAHYNIISVEVPTYLGASWAAERGARGAFPVKHIKLICKHTESE